MATDRDAQQVKAEIEKARDQLAGAVDQLADRLAPKRLAAEAQANARAKLETPAGKAAMGGVALLITLIVVRNLRKSKKRG